MRATIPPSARCFAVMSPKMRRPPSSKQVSGSSKSHSAARFKSSRASASRRRCPADNRRPQSVLAHFQNRQRLLRRGQRRTVAQGGGDLQIFQRRQIVLDSVLVADVNQFGMIILGGLANIFFPPKHRPFVGRGQPAKRPQQSGFSRPVASDNLQRPPRLQRKTHPPPKPRNRQPPNFPAPANFSHFP